VEVTLFICLRCCYGFPNPFLLDYKGEKAFKIERVKRGKGRKMAVPFKGERVKR